MKFEESIFGKFRREKGLNVNWEDKGMFPLLKDLGEIEGKLTGLGFGRVIGLDEIGENWEDWYIRDCLTLSVLPISNIIDQTGTKTKESLRNYVDKVKENFMPADIETSEEHKRENFVVYFPTRNLVIALVNPFLDKKVFDIIIDNVTQLNPKFMDEKAIWEHKLETQWKQNFAKRKQEVKHKLDGGTGKIENLRTEYFERITEMNDLKQEMVNLEKGEEDVKQYIEKELEDIKKLPIIKELLIRDKIYVSFGTVHLIGKVETGRTTRDGVEVPIVEPKKVEIGNLTFEIGEGKVVVKNDKPVSGHEHPHASEGRICFGEADLEAQKLLASMEIAKLIKLLYSWAFSYNDDNPYMLLQDFYDARKKEENENTQRRLSENN